MPASEYTNRYGTIRLGDFVIISPKVGDTDNMRTYVDDRHPLLKVTKIISGGLGDSASITLESWDGRTTERVGWAIAPVDGLKGCQLCVSGCKEEEPCVFFKSVLEGREEQ